MALRYRRPALAVALLLATSAPADTVYRWIAPDGSVNFSSTPPHDADAEAMELAPPTPLTETELEAQRERVRLMHELAAQMEEERRAREAAAVVRRTPTVRLAPAEKPPADGALEFDDWWTGPARPAPVAPPVVSKSSGGGDHPDFQPNTTRAPSFH